MKKIFITGASRGIGLSEALALKNNHELYLCAKTTDSFRDKGIDSAHVFGFDLENPENITKLFSAIEQETETLDVLVNNIGVFLLKKFEDMNEEDIEYLININLRTTILITKKFLPLLLKGKSPQIIFMSSMSAKSSINGESVYSATKAGITNFANVLRNELGDRVRVSVIHSWGIDTFGGNNGLPLLQPEDVAKILECIIESKPPFNIESIDIGHQGQWRGGMAPWSPR